MTKRKSHASGIVAEALLPDPKHNAKQNPLSNDWAKGIE